MARTKSEQRTAGALDQRPAADGVPGADGGVTVRGTSPDWPGASAVPDEAAVREELAEEDEQAYRPSWYVRALGLRQIEPVGWQRGIVAEGSVLVGVLVALADLASAWIILILPVTVALVVVLHDLVAGRPRDADNY